MSRLIDADKLKRHYSWWAGCEREMTMDEAKSDFDTIIDLQPTAVELVRCKDCKFRNGHCTLLVDAYNEFNDNSFCSLGMRKDKVTT